MADEIEFMENYKTHVASAVIMMKVSLDTCQQWDSGIHCDQNPCTSSVPSHSMHSTCPFFLPATPFRAVCDSAVLQQTMYKQHVLLLQCIAQAWCLAGSLAVSTPAHHWFAWCIELQAALPHLVKSRGNIVNMSSMMSQTYKTIQMAYNASKAMEDAVSFTNLA